MADNVYCVNSAAQRGRFAGELGKKYMDIRMLLWFNAPMNIISTLSNLVYRCVGRPDCDDTSNSPSTSAAEAIYRDSFEKGTSAFQRGDYRTASNEFYFVTMIHPERGTLLL